MVVPKIPLKNPFLSEFLLHIELSIYITLEFVPNEFNYEFQRERPAVLVRTVEEMSIEERCDGSKYSTVGLTGNY